MKWLNRTKAVQYLNGEVKMVSDEVRTDLNRFSQLVEKEIAGLPLFEKPSDFVYHVQNLYMKNIGYGEIFVDTTRYPQAQIEITVFDKEVNSNITVKLDMTTGHYNNAPDVEIHYYRNSSFYHNFSNDDLFKKMKDVNAFIEKEVLEIWIRILNTKKISGDIRTSYRHELELNAFNDKAGNHNDFFKIELKDMGKYTDEFKNILKHNITILQNSKKLLKELMKLEEPIEENSQLGKFFDSLQFVDSYRDSETIEWDVYSF